MKFKRIWTIYFNPTSGTKAVAEWLAEYFGETLRIPVNEKGFALPVNREKIYHFGEDDLR